jgi:hypothetical protein
LGISFFYHIDNFSTSDPNAKGSALLAYDLLIKHILQIDAKTAHRYYLYNHYLRYAYNNVFDYYLYGKDYEKALDFGYKSLLALEKQPYLDSVFYSTTFTQPLLPN